MHPRAGRPAQRDGEGFEAIWWREVDSQQSKNPRLSGEIR